MARSQHRAIVATLYTSTSMLFYVPHPFRLQIILIYTAEELTIILRLYRSALYISIVFGLAACSSQDQRMCGQLPQPLYYNDCAWRKGLFTTLPLAGNLNKDYDPIGANFYGQTIWLVLCYSVYMLLTCVSLFCVWRMKEVASSWLYLTWFTQCYRTC